MNFTLLSHQIAPLQGSAAAIPYTKASRSTFAKLNLKTPTPLQRLRSQTFFSKSHIFW